MTGSVPSYTDVILTLDQAKELKEDNFVDSAFSNGRSIVFYGDTVWMKMFPRKFKRQGPVLPFFDANFMKVCEKSDIYTVVISATQTVARHFL